MYFYISFKGSYHNLAGKMIYWNQSRLENPTKY